MSNFMNRMRAKFANFMYGRNGNDQLNAFLLGATLVVLIAGLFFQGTVKSIINIVVLALLAYIYFRMLSRNLVKRRNENSWFIQKRYKVFNFLKGLKERWVQRKEYKFFYCPSCHATLRVPRGHGKINIVCRKCGKSFTGKS